MGFDGYGDFPAYLSVAKRRARAQQRLKALARKGKKPSPIVIEGRTIATTFWGKAWCDYVEGHAALVNRLERGRSYVRSGMVIDLEVTRGQVRALVSGTDLYEVVIEIAPLPGPRWKAVRRRCGGQIGTLVELLAGRFSSAVMEVLSHREQGLFPAKGEMALRCSCPDGEWVCKHVAAVVYGVGARLDHAPELLFTLRGVDGADLIAEAGKVGQGAPSQPGAKGLAAGQLEDIFGIELEGDGVIVAKKASRRAPPPAKAMPTRPAGKVTRRGAKAKKRASTRLGS
jgi:uncharacterized Zn finger protein